MHYTYLICVLSQDSYYITSDICQGDFSRGKRQCHVRTHFGYDQNKSQNKTYARPGWRNKLKWRSNKKKKLSKERIVSREASLFLFIYFCRGHLTSQITSTAGRNFSVCFKKTSLASPASKTILYL